MDLNKRQRIILMVTAAAILLLFLFPPYFFFVEKLSFGAGHGFLFSPPILDEELPGTRVSGVKAQIEAGVMAAQILALLVAGVLCAVACKDKDEK